MVPPLVQLALDYYRTPLAYTQLADVSRPLPAGFPALLSEFGAALAGTQIADTAAALSTDAETLQRAARFFARHVLLDPAGDYYRYLGLTRDASPEAVRSHYQLLIGMFHPDRLASTGDAELAYASRLNAAYRVLRDPAARARYDQGLPRSPARARGGDPGAFFRPRPPPLRPPRPALNQHLGRLARHPAALLGIAAGLMLGAGLLLMQRQTPPTLRLAEPLDAPARRPLPHYLEARPDPDPEPASPARAAGELDRAVAAGGHAEAPMLHGADAPAAVASSDPTPSAVASPVTAHAVPMAPAAAAVATGGAEDQAAAAAVEARLESALAAGVLAAEARLEKLRREAAAEQARRAEEQRLRAAEQQARRGEEQRLRAAAEQARRAEEQRLQAAAEQARRAEEQRLQAAAEQARRAEEQRLQAAAEQALRAEEQRLQAAAGRARAEAEARAAARAAAENRIAADAATASEPAADVRRRSVEPAAVGANLVRRLENAYQRGDADALASLFTANARTSDGRGQGLIRDQYARAFEGFQSQRLSVDGMRWQSLSDGRLQGIGRVAVAARDRTGGPWRRSSGRLELELVPTDAGYRISAMLYQLK